MAVLWVVASCSLIITMTYELDSHRLMLLQNTTLPWHCLHLYVILFQVGNSCLTFFTSKSQGLLDVTCIMNNKDIPAIKVTSVSWLLTKYASILLRLVSAWCSEQKHSSWPARLVKLYSLPPFLEVAIPWSEWLQFHTIRKSFNIQSLKKTQHRIRGWELFLNTCTSSNIN